MNNAEIIIKTEKLAKSFTEGQLHVDVLSQLDLAIYTGEMVAIVGVSGSGKSTLLHCLSGLELPSSGAISLYGKSYASLSETARGYMRNQYLGFVYQFHHLLPEFTALENVAMPLLISNTDENKAFTAAKELLDAVGLHNRLDHKPAELSGGERQRTAIARALSTKPKCVLADEPTGNLDRKNREAIYELIFSIHATFNTTFVIVTHDESLCQRMHRTLVLQDGKLLSQ